MWSLRQKPNGTFYLTYDKFRYHTYNLPGIWEFVGKQGSAGIDRIIRVNEQAGYTCVNDDEGSVRALVLGEGADHV